MMSRIPMQALLLGSVSAVLLLAAAGDPAWITKPPAPWPEADAKQVLKSSPWVKMVKANIYRAPTEDALRDGGKMGQPTGVGYQGVPNNGPKFQDLVSKDLFKGGANPTYVPPQINLQVRWESALPVRMAELKTPDGPGVDGIGDRGYAVSVWGLPGSFFDGDPKKLGEPLKEQAFLRREGKKDVRPISAEVYTRSDGVVVVYIFPLSAELSKKDGFVTLAARIGRIGFTLPFNLSEMEFMGKLEL